MCTGFVEIASGAGVYDGMEFLRCTACGPVSLRDTVGPAAKPRRKDARRGPPTPVPSATPCALELHWRSRAENDPEDTRAERMGKNYFRRMLDLKQSWVDAETYCMDCCMNATYDMECY